MAMNTKDLKKLIDEDIDHYSLFSFYLKDHYPGGIVTPGKVILSPVRAENNPSFNIFQLKNGKWKYVDFAGEQGDIYSLVMQLFNISFKQSVQKIAYDMGINSLDADTSMLASLKMPHRTPPKPLISKMSFEEKPFSEKELLWWGQYGITDNVLKEYNVRSARKVVISRSDNKEFIYQSSDANPVFVYVFYDNTIKMYQPLAERKNKFRGSSSVFGFDKAEKGKPIVLSAGQKDVMSLYANTGIRGVSLGSEKNLLTTEHYLLLKEMSDHLFVCYDTDATGKKRMKEISEEYDIHPIDLELFTYDPKIKDISLYYKRHLEEKLLNPEETEDLLGLYIERVSEKISS